MNDSIRIRPLERRDRDGWGRLWSAYLAFYGTSRPDEIFDLSFARLIGDDPRDFSGFVAVVDGRLVGLAHYLFHRHGWERAETCYLQDLYTEADMRGRGVGRMLIEAVYDAADSHGAVSTYWLTQDFNADARKLYDRVGSLTPFVKYVRA